MKVPERNSIDGRIGNLDPRYLWRVLKQPVARQPASLYRDIDLADLRIERAQWDVLNRVLHPRTRKGLFQVVSMAVDRGTASVEDHQVGVQLGWVSVVGRVDIADIVGREVDLRQMKRRVYRVLDIDDISLIDSEAVDSERVRSLKRILPSFLP